MALFIGLAFTGIFQTPFYVSIGLSLRQKKSNWKLIRIAMGAFIISSIILIMLVPFLSDLEKPTFSIMHDILGGIHFVVMAIAFLFYGIIEFLNPSISNEFTVISFNSALLYGLNIIFSNITLIYWIAIAGIFLWIFVHIKFLIRSKQ